MLERYRLGELLPEDKKTLEEVLVEDDDLRTRLTALDESDQELRLRYPQKDFLPRSPTEEKAKTSLKLRVPPWLNPYKITTLRQSRLVVAAVVLVCFLLPVIYYLRLGSEAAFQEGVPVAPEGPVDRAKGTVLTGAELSLYLEGDGEILLSNRAVLREGNTVQLAYTIGTGEHYGVIFSIDGRAQVTRHYPYRKGQSSLLVSGKRTFLNEAYTLDDAPDYEVFFMVISEEPLDVDVILSDAQKIAETVDFLSSDLSSTEGKERAFGSGGAFKDYKVETLTMLKEKAGQDE